MGKLIDETGNRYGRLLVLYRAKNSQRKGVYWHCKCDCGNEVDIFAPSLRNGNTKSCGCLKHDKIIESNIKRGKKVSIGDRYGSLIIKKIQPNQIYCLCDCGKEKWVSRQDLLSGDTKTCGCGIGLVGSNYIDEIGNKYGLLTVIEKYGKNQEGRILWRCKCDCGNEKITLGKSLRAGLVKSCGCIHSLGEQKINNILTELNINFISQKAFADLKSDLGRPLFFDFYLPDYNILIEYQGEQHYNYNNRGWNTKENFKLIQRRDKLKRQYCVDHNILLIEIPYTDYDKINKKYLQKLLEENNENSLH